MSQDKSTYPQPRQQALAHWIMRIFVAIFACVVLGYAIFIALIHLIFAELGHQTDRAHTRALTEVAQNSDRFGEAVVQGADEPSDQRLDELAGESLQVYSIRRSPQLSLILAARSPDGVIVGASMLTVCYQMTFSDLGTPAARFEKTELASCPLERRQPQTTPSPRPG